MKNPFRYGEAVSGDFFTDRYREREYLLAELGQGHNVLLTGPVQSGKSSLARKVMAEFDRRGVMTVYLDLERAYSSSRFIEVYLSELLRAAFRQPKELREFIQTLAPDVRDQLRLKVEQNDELVVDLTGGGDLDALAAAVLDLSRYAVDYKKRPCVICLDEISEGGNLPDVLRNRFFTAAAEQSSVGYLLVSLETSRKRIPDGFVHLPLEKIEERYLMGHIKTRFENTGFRIDETLIADILKTSENQVHVVQMISRELWNQSHTSKIISAKTLAQAMESLLETYGEYYASQWHDLSLHQKNLLLAVARGGGQKIFSQEFVARFGLGSFSTVQKSLSRLLARQILERRGDGYVIRDLFFKRWLSRRML